MTSGARRGRSLRTRLVVAMVAIAVAVLGVTGAATLLLTQRAAEQTARQDLEDRAPEITAAVRRVALALRTQEARGLTGSAPYRALIAATLRVSNASLVEVGPGGTVTEGVTGLGKARDAFPLPAGLTVEDLDGPALAAGQTQTGRVGSTVFLAQPITGTRVLTPVLVLTEELDTHGARRAAGFFVLAGIVAVVVAAVLATWLARRMTRPLAAVGATAHRIAGGDLGARSDLGPRPDREIAEVGHAVDGMAAQLEHARGLERAFVLSVSHDLRTPLTSIRGYGEALLDGTITDADGTRHAAEVIVAESARLERLVADLLDLARLDARQFSLTPREVDATAVVRTAVDAFRPAATELGLGLTLTGDTALPAIADPERLGQIVANLVENALKYATSGVQVQVSAEGERDVVLRVHDDGPGLAAGDATRVFDRLYVSRDRPGRTVGTGLGLAIVRELATAMGGQASVDPAPDAGATFVVRLPLRTP